MTDKPENPDAGVPAVLEGTLTVRSVPAEPPTPAPVPTPPVTPAEPLPAELQVIQAERDGEKRLRDLERKSLADALAVYQAGVYTRLDSVDTSIKEMRATQEAERRERQDEEKSNAASRALTQQVAANTSRVFWLFCTVIVGLIVAGIWSALSGWLHGLAHIKH